MLNVTTCTRSVMHSPVAAAVTEGLYRSPEAAANAASEPLPSAPRERGTDDARLLRADENDGSDTAGGACDAAPNDMRDSARACACDGDCSGV